jgi:NAD(P)-dependent dehydrogenase (short-subunit alcohol dehydrogenase family)
MTGYVRTILVTGSNTGIGYELVKLLASQGHNVWLASRNEQSGKAAQYVVKWACSLDLF